MLGRRQLDGFVRDVQAKVKMRSCTTLHHLQRMPYYARASWFLLPWLHLKSGTKPSCWHANEGVEPTDYVIAVWVSSIAAHSSETLISPQTSSSVWMAMVLSSLFNCGPLHFTG